MIAGTIYGVVLNDAQERAELAAAFSKLPYTRPPEAPVVYIKPRNTMRPSPALVELPDDTGRLSACATLALLFGRDISRADSTLAWGSVCAVALALDLSIPAASYYRPTVLERSCDGFLPLGSFGAPMLPKEIVTSIDGAPAHQWSLDRLVRRPGQLIADLSQFMTLRRGDLLMVGLPGDPPTVGRGQKVEVHADGLPPVSAMMGSEWS